MGRKKAFSPEQELEVCEMYERIERAAPVAAAFGVNMQTIYRVLEKHDIPRTHRHPERERRKSGKGSNHKGIDRGKVGELYKSGMTVPDIARTLGCTGRTVCYHLDKLGIARTWQRKDANHALIPRIIELLEQGKSYREIAETLGVGRDVVCKRVAKLGLGGGKGSNSSAGGKASAEKRRAACIRRFKSVADKVVLVDYKARDITVRCVECGTEFAWYKQHWHMDVPCPVCRERAKQEEREKERERRQYELEQQQEAAREWRLSVPILCRECGEPFYTEHGHTLYCSERCKRKAKNRRQRGRNNRSVGNPYKCRMRIKPTPETYDRRIRDVGFVFKKYHGICCGCGCKTVRTKEYAPNQATLDHIIALANNGTHTEDNVQLLCSDCNSAKRDLGQMRLPIAV